MDKLDTQKRGALEALEKSLGVVTTACKSIGLARSTFYEWMKEDSFKQAVNEIQEVALDFAESQLHKQIADGNTSATIFYLKTKGKKRGFVERQEISAPDGKEFTVEIIDRTVETED